MTTTRHIHPHEKSSQSCVHWDQPCFSLVWWASSSCLPWCTIQTNSLICRQDRNIIATAIPKITDEFHSIGDVGWYASAYSTSHRKQLFTCVSALMPCLTTLACTEEIPVLTCSTVLTASALMLLFGKFYTFYPPKRVLLIAISLFELGSAICGSAPNSIAFIIGRAIGGLG